MKYTLIVYIILEIGILIMKRLFSAPCRNKFRKIYGDQKIVKSRILIFTNFWRAAYEMTNWQLWRGNF